MLTKEGYAPSELNPVHLNRWESFWSKRGFYQEKTTKAENYAQYVKSQKGLERDRISYNEWLDTYDFIRKNPATKETADYCKAYQEKIDSIVHPLREQMFADVSLKEGKPDALNIWRLSCAPYTRGAMLLVNEGITPEEIMDPTARLEEKAAAGKRLAALQQRDDPHEFAQIMHSAVTKLVQQPEFGLDFTSHADMMEKAGKVEFYGAFLHDVWQEITRSSVVPAMEDVAINEERQRAGLPPYTDRAAYREELKSGRISRRRSGKPFSPVRRQVNRPHTNWPTGCTESPPPIRKSAARPKISIRSPRP